LLRYKVPRRKYYGAFLAIILCSMLIIFVSLNFIVNRGLFTYLYLLALVVSASSILYGLFPGDLIISDDYITFKRKNLPAKTVLYYRWVHFPDTEGLRKTVGLQFFQRTSTYEVTPAMFLYEGTVQVDQKREVDDFLLKLGIKEIKQLDEIKEKVKNRSRFARAEPFNH